MTDHDEKCEMMRWRNNVLVMCYCRERWLDARLREAVVLAAHWKEQAEQVQGALAEAENMNAKAEKIAARLAEEQSRHAETLQHNADIGTALMEARARLAEAVAETDRLNAQALELCAELSGLRRRLGERLVAYCVCTEQKSPVDGCDCVCCTTTRLEARLAEATALLQRVIDEGGREGWPVIVEFLNDNER